MTLNIKNPQAHKLAQELAKATGETMTDAVTVAIRERLSRIRRGQPATLSAELLEIGKRCARALKVKPVNHADLLYDERGLPK